SAAGNRFDLVTPTGVVPVFSPMRGRVNVYNVLAASAAGYARGCSLDQIAKGIGSLARVPGRFESVDEGQPFSVVVDYAHTDDALKNLTSLAREFVAKNGGRVLTVFGCGGDRDRAKRPMMGEAAGKGSNFVVLTSDNPRSEDPLAIMNDALLGLQRTQTPYVLEPDRRKAIAKALSEAEPGDIVLIAGKGHERTQTTREGIFPFDDFEVAREELNKLGYQKG
ncbi:MAG TPA: cyanophycin synthetase, partial [Terriglobales bacterium]